MRIGLYEIIGQLLNSKDSSTHEFRRLWNMAVFGLKTEFNLDITGTYKTVVLTVNANKTVTLPSDYIDYSKVGVLNNIGEVMTFSVNNSLSTYNGIYTATANSRTSGVPTMGSTSYPVLSPYNYYLNYWWNGNEYNLYGANSGTPVIGEFKIDESQGVIFLSSQMTNANIVLEYLSDGLGSVNGEPDYFIDVRVTQAMIAYLRWQDSIDQRKKFSDASVRNLKVEYYRNKRIAKMRVNKFNVSDMNRVTRLSTKLAAKA